MASEVHTHSKNTWQRRGSKCPANVWCDLLPYQSEESLETGWNAFGFAGEKQCYPKQPSCAHFNISVSETALPAVHSSMETQRHLCWLTALWDKQWSYSFPMRWNEPLESTFLWSSPPWKRWLSLIPPVTPPSVTEGNCPKTPWHPAVLLPSLRPALMSLQARLLRMIYSVVWDCLSYWHIDTVERCLRFEK